MKHIAFYTICCLVLVNLFSACSTVGDNTTTTFVDIEDQIELNIFQDLEHVDNYFLHISTIKDDLCSESKFITNFTSTGENLIVDLQGLETPNDCSNFNSRISENKSFGFEETSFVIDFTLATNIKNKIYIDHGDGQLNFITNQLEGVTFEKTQLFEVQEQFIWGGLNSTNENDFAKFSELQAAINNVALISLLAPGNYGYFDNTNETIAYHPETFDKYEIGFAFKIPSEVSVEETDIPAMVKSFRDSNPEMQFFIGTGNGGIL